MLSARSLGGSGYVWFPFSPSLSSHLSPSLIPLLLSLSLSFLQYTSTLGQAFALCDSSRNVPDDVLRNVTTNRGLVMVNFYANFICCQDTCALADVARHIVHIRDVSGIDHVGIGGDYDTERALRRLFTACMPEPIAWVLFFKCREQGVGGGWVTYKKHGPGVKVVPRAFNFNTRMFLNVVIMTLKYVLYPILVQNS